MMIRVLAVTDLRQMGSGEDWRMASTSAFVCFDA
jgi:hypothetical protein